MKLGTVKDGSRDGILVVFAGDPSRGVAAPVVAPALQQAPGPGADAGPAHGQLHEDRPTEGADSALRCAWKAGAAPHPPA